MGRFYESTAGQFVDDKMFQAPAQLMQNVLLGKDKAIDTEISTAVSLYDKLKADVLQQDNPRAKEIIKGYETEIDDIVTNIRKNPLEYSKYSRDISGIGRKLNEDWSTGEMGILQNNKKKLLDYYNNLDDIHKKDPDKYDAEYITALKANALKDYKEGAQFNVQRNKASNELQLDEASILPNLFEEFSKVAKDIKVDGYNIEQAYSNGPYIYKNGNGNKEVSKDKLLNAFNSWVKGQTSYNGSIKQRKDLSIKGFEDADSTDILRYDDAGKLIGVSGNYYGRNAAAIANTFYSKETTHTEDIKNNSWFEKQWDANREDEKTKKADETAEITFPRVFTTDAGNITNFSKALTSTNVGLATIKEDAGELANSVGITSDMKAYKDIQNGNFSSLQGRVSPEKYSEITSSYRQHNARKIVLDAQNLAFVKWANKNNVKGKEKIGTTLGWTTDKNLQDAYTKFTSQAGVKDKNDVLQTVSFNGMRMDKALKDNFKKTFIENFDDVVFKLEGTPKGEGEIRENKNGQKLIYTSDKSKANALTKDNKARYYYVPDGQLTVARMVQDGVLEKEIVVGTEGEDKKTVYSGFSGGKKVGLKVDENTLGLVSGYDGTGKANLGASVTLGNNRGIATMDAKQITSPTLRQAINDRQEDFEFDLIDNQTNWQSLDRITKTIEGDTYHIDKGVVYMNGVPMGNSKDKLAIKRLLLGY